MRARNTLTRSSWRATSASREIPIPLRTWPCWPPLAWVRRRRWWIFAPVRAAAAAVANLACVQAGFLSYQHAGPPADAVYTRNALHQLPDFWKAVALDRISRMLRPGGVLRLRDLIYDFQPSEADTVVQRWLDNAADNPAEGYTSADFAEHIRIEHSTFRWLLEPMLAATG